MEMSIKISDDKTLLDIDLIHTFLTNSYWGKGLTRDTLLKRIDNSICFGIYENSKQIGFARVITDYSNLAYLFDVFIIESHRKKGYSIKLLDYIFSYPPFKEIRSWMLRTSDAHELYKKFGFKAIPHPEEFMIMVNKVNP